MQASLRQELRGVLGVSEGQLNRLIQRAPHTYKVYTIPKKSGGERVIAQPAKETKFIQRWMIENIFQNLPVHPSAMAYEKGSSIKKNAYAHKENSYIAKFDFKDFFNSIRAVDIISHIEKYYGEKYCIEDINDIARISCIKGDGEGLFLSIGAPSSPILSNTIMFDFDCKVHAWCNVIGITYTRYADDLTFSTNVKDILGEIQSTINDAIKSLEYPKLKLNAKKTIHLSRKHQRRITGLIVTNDGNISLGRDRKREISALTHKFSLDLLPEDEIYRLQGLLGFAKDVEPLFLARIKEKYTKELIENILKKRKKPMVY